MAARSLASGTIAFGLVAIPVKLYSTSESSNDVSFSMVHAECGTKVKYRYYCPTHDALVERGDLAKGYEFAKGQYVLFSQEELKALSPEPTHSIDIQEFVPLAEVDPIYFEKSYYLGPDKGGARPYKLLSEAMRQTGRAAVGKYAARGKNYLVLLRPFADGLIMQQLRYAAEVRAFSEVPVTDAELKDGEVQLALQLVEQSTSEAFRPEAYEDEETRRVWAMIEQKVQGQEIVAAPQETPKAQIIDLMEALKASLGEAQGKAARKPAASRKPAGKAAAGKKKAASK